MLPVHDAIHMTQTVISTRAQRFTNRLKRIKNISLADLLAKIYTETQIKSIIQKLNRIVAHIIRAKIDFTVTNRVWFDKGCALANELTESGREYFCNM